MDRRRDASQRKKCNGRMKRDVSQVLDILMRDVYNQQERYYMRQITELLSFWTGPEKDSPVRGNKQ